VSAPPILFINEFLASNDSDIQDEFGDFEDWVELYNPGPDPVELGGLFITDDLGDISKWQFPDTTLAAGGFLIVWCDEELDEGPLHADIKLSAGGEEIGLYGAPHHGFVLIDSRIFGPQTTDVSEGRVPDAGPQWAFYTTPTPGAPNQNPVATLEGVGGPLAFSLAAPHPNPFGSSTHLRFQVPVTGHAALEVFDVRGTRVAVLHDGLLPPGHHDLRWRFRPPLH
jgi:hypothetical protein